MLNYYQLILILHYKIIKLIIYLINKQHHNHKLKESKDNILIKLGNYIKVNKHN
jgi:hypothetical protein